MNPGVRRLSLLLLLLICLLALPACALRGRGGPARPAAAETAAVTNEAPTAAATEAAPQATASSAPAATSAPTAGAPQPAAGGEPEIRPVQFTTGRNDYSFRLEGVPRQVIVYVPAGYDPQRPTPVVFMFHGSNQSGQLMFQSTQWTRKADQENFIVVFPTSWKYRLVGEDRLQDKWNVYNLSQIAEPGAELKDDVQFTRTILDTLEATFNVDPQRIYATGFSNGGVFVLTRLLIEMSDVFAAYAISGAGIWNTSQPNETQIANLPASIDRPLYIIIGTNDEIIADGTGSPLPLPIRPDEITASPVFSDLIGNITTLLGLEQTPSVQVQPPSVILTFDKSTAGGQNQWILRVAGMMAHVYPSGDNNRAGLDAADIFWDFFQPYTLER